LRSRILCGFLPARLYTRKGWLAEEDNAVVTSSRVVLDHLHIMLARRSGADDDSHLLRQFAQTGDGEAFAALVHRHGPMVLGLARRVVDDWQTAEDVFQATFLMLARRAHTIRRPESLSCWLHGVAFRLALRARHGRRRRQERETHARYTSPPTPLDELTARELLSVLDEELQHLPVDYRAAVILCCLEGLSQEEAAKRLHCSPGAVKGRLERGRERLRRRLQKRGLMLPAVLGGSLLIAESARAVPAALVQSTVNAVRTGTGATSAAVDLVQGALHGMIANRLKALGATLVLLAVAGSGLGMLGLHAPAAREASAGGPAGADRRDAAPPEKGKDMHGDPLPPGALMRLGTLRRRAVGAKLAVSADGKSIVSVRAGKGIRIWDAATGELRQARELPGEEWGPAELSPDGRLLARVVSNPDYRLEIWEVRSGNKLRDLTIKDSGYIMPVAFSSDGRRIAAVGHRRGNQAAPGGGNLDTHLVRAWEVATGKEIFAADVRNNVSSHLIAFSPDGQRLLASFSSVDEGMYCWDLATGRRIWQNKAFGHTAILFTPDGKILSSQQQPRAVDLKTGQNVQIAQLPPFNWDTHLALTPDGQTLLLANNKGVIVWDLKEGKELRTLKGAGEEMLVMPDGKSLLTNNGALQRWDLATGKALWTDTSDFGHLGEVAVVKFSADGKRLVSTSTDGSVRLWDTTTSRLLRVWRGHEGKRPIPVMSFAEAGVKALDLSADGRRVVSAGTDECIKLWDIGSDQEVRNIPLPRAENGEWGRRFYQVRISPDGRRVIGSFGPRGGTVAVGQPPTKLTDKLAVWDAESGDLLELHPVEMGHGNSVLAPDARTLLTGDTLIDVMSAQKIAQLPALSGFEQGSFSGDSALIVGQAEKKMRQNGIDMIGPDGLAIWEAATGKIVARLKTKSWVAQTVFHPDNRFIVTNDLDGVHLRDVRSGEVLAHFKMPESIRAASTRGSYAACLAFSRDGRRMATGLPDSTILLWDVRVPPVSVEPLTAKELDVLWSDLADADAAKAWQAVWRLAEAPNEALPFLRGHLKPFATAPADEMRRLLAALDDESFERREAAAKGLKELGLRAEPALRAALKANPSLEQKRRIETILAALAEAPQPLSAEDLRQLRVLIVLERIGTPNARSVLEDMAKGPESARLTRQALAALACLR
jgi:RNA polymerase sigma factor (sigma-70 family)